MSEEFEAEKERFKNIIIQAENEQKDQTQLPVERVYNPNLVQNLEKLSIMYQEISAKSSQRLGEKSTNDKPQRKTERMLDLEKQLYDTKDLVDKYKAKIESLKSLINLSTNNGQTFIQDYLTKKNKNNDEDHIPCDNNDNSMNQEKSQAQMRSEQKYIRMIKTLESKQKNNEPNKEDLEDNCELKLKEDESRQEEFKQNSEANSEHKSMNSEQKKGDSEKSSEANMPKVN